MPLKFRKLTDDDLTNFKQLRLEALKTNPESFGSHFAREAANEDVKFLRLLSNDADNFIMGAFENKHLISMVGFYIDENIGNIWGVFTTPQFRGPKISKRLMQEVLSVAKQCPAVNKIQLGVTSESPAALGLYKALGFITYEIAEDAITHSDEPICEILMELEL